MLEDKKSVDLKDTSDPSSRVESSKNFEKGSPSIPFFRLMFDHGYIPANIRDYRYPGSGTEADPFLVEWTPIDPRNPMNTSPWKRWLWTFLESLATFAVTLTTSGYSAGPHEIYARFGPSQEVYHLGFSVFVLGFALGPLIWGPLSECYGRQLLFFLTFGVFAAFNAATIVVPNTAGLVLMRFIKGSFGSSLLANAGGVVADIFEPRQRGLGIVVFSTAPLLGPVLGPVFGGLISQHAGFQWLEGFLTLLSGILWVVVSLTVPETYTPLLLERRAQRLTKITGKYHVSKLNRSKDKSLWMVLKVALTRPWVLLFREPIVLLLSIYMAILYGTLYLFFAAFPIVFSQHRGWDETHTGLAFLGIGAGVILGIIYTFFDHAKYAKLQETSSSELGPEARLPQSLVGCIAIPIGLFWFAWTITPTIHFMAPLVGSIPFGFGFVLVYISSQNYLVDAYTVYAASVLAANTLMRSALGAAFPLFTQVVPCLDLPLVMLLILVQQYMYDGLGINWASTVPAILATLCVPFPFLFWKRGEKIRRRCKYAAEAEEVRRAAFMKIEGLVVNSIQPRTAAWLCRIITHFVRGLSFGSILSLSLYRVRDSVPDPGVRQWLITRSRPLAALKSCSSAPTALAMLVDSEVGSWISALPSHKNWLVESSPKFRFDIWEPLRPKTIEPADQFLDDALRTQDRLVGLRYDLEHIGRSAVNQYFVTNKTLTTTPNFPPMNTWLGYNANAVCWKTHQEQDVQRQLKSNIEVLLEDYGSGRAAASERRTELGALIGLTVRIVKSSKDDLARHRQEKADLMKGH
ncbi:MAG: hypothetical protein Q9200_000946 [Gallowayella weberi]